MTLPLPAITSLEVHMWEIHHYPTPNWTELSREVWHIELHRQASTSIESEYWPAQAEPREHR